MTNGLSIHFTAGPSYRKINNTDWRVLSTDDVLFLFKKVYCPVKSYSLILIRIYPVVQSVHQGQREKFFLNYFKFPVT